jgi:hypothetical protein
MKYGLSGRYKIAIINAKTKRVRWQQRKWQHNLIMNNGMNKIASSLLCDCFTYAIAGTGTTTGDEVSADYGTTATGDVAGNVALVGGTFVFDTVLPGDQGNIIKWNSTGFEGRIVSMSDTTHAVISPLPSAPQSGNFVLYRTNFNILDNETVRTNNYVPVAPYCGTTLIGNMLVHQRTWDFPEEVGTINYTEMGVGWTGTLNDTSDPLGGSVFARFLLHSVTALNAGEQLRLTYQLRVVLEPYASLAKTASITGWPLAPATDTDGDERVQLLGMSIVSSVGATTNFDTGNYANEPSRTTNVAIFLSTSSAALASFGSVVDRYTSFTHSQQAVTSPSYALHSYTKIKQITFSSSEANSTSWRSMGVGWDGGGSNAGQFNTNCFVFDQAQSKLLTHTLNLQYFFTWSRVLSPSSV